ncbi:hypothetical protein HOY82DRAFT_601515 [Tuber indicum]|nr:hypothetical protein HOY82DRAFT_601515 [Tuber indicum]
MLSLHPTFCVVSWTLYLRITRLLQSPRIVTTHKVLYSEFLGLAKLYNQVVLLIGYLLLQLQFNFKIFANLITKIIYYILIPSSMVHLVAIKSIISKYVGTEKLPDSAFTPSIHVVEVLSK